MANDPILIRWLGIQPYEPVWQAMQSYTEQRDADSPDQIWLLEHSPVFTQGQAGKAEHLLDIGDIPVVQVDRGGQVTYHGPGQLIVYLLIDLRRRKLGVREMVDLMEQSLIELLAEYSVTAFAKPDAPGVYVDDAKIASLGLRVRKGCTFHGLALNVDLDLEPFLRINPCGYAGMRMTRLADLAKQEGTEAVSQQLLEIFLRRLDCGVIDNKYELSECVNVK